MEYVCASGSLKNSTCAAAGKEMRRISRKREKSMLAGLIEGFNGRNIEIGPKNKSINHQIVNRKSTITDESPCYLLPSGKLPGMLL
jgi:hypothetical protein